MGESPLFTTYSELNLPASLQSALKAMNYVNPTPIQTQAIPLALEGHDLIGQAQTGTGKTAAFSIPLLLGLIKNPQATALILAPTRELAIQIEEVLKKLTQFMPDMKGALLIGGLSMSNQMRALRMRPRIVIATPGRLLDHLRQRNMTLKFVRTLVLDEADRMLDMGFAPQLEAILAHLPPKGEARQTLLFSATLPKNILDLASKFLLNPKRVTVGEVNQVATQINQKVMSVTLLDKNKVLIEELKERQGSVLIFARTKRRTDKLARFLNDEKFRAERIHGDRSQKQRIDALEGFRSGRFRILVATDVAARGIDVSNIAHVINYDIPAAPEDYVHRIGRTGRAGKTGEAISLVTSEERGLWKAIVRRQNAPGLPDDEKRSGHGPNGRFRPRR